MSAEKKLQPKQMYELLCNRHPTIIPLENENLSIEDATIRILKKCWSNTIKYPTIKQIAEVTDISERTIYLYAIKYQFEGRIKNKTKSYGKKQNVQSI